MKTVTVKFDLTNVEKLGCWEDFYKLIGLTAKKKELDEELKPAPATGFLTLSPED